jgi:hypothetical protein
MILIAFFYGGVVLATGSIPAASNFFGHTLGIIGFILMLMTEILYSLRKRSRSARWGRMAYWLKFHIYTGLVGPFLVLLHSSWKFNGIAGVVMLLTMLIVFSGFVGRYIYTSVPRSVDGIAYEKEFLESEIANIEIDMNKWLADQAVDVRNAGVRLASVPPSSYTNSFFAILGRSFSDFEYHYRVWQQKKLLRSGQKMQLKQLDVLLSRKRVLERQISSLAYARKMLSLWHTIHVPIGITLFIAAIMHIGGAIYYATLLH